MLYVAFEGGEGSGKSTQAARLADRLGGRLTREPGGTPLGVELRRLLLSPDEHPVSARAEALLMAADRAQHLHEVVGPALAAGVPVVSDRSVFSSLAYQGAGRSLGVEAVRALNEFALDGRWPDLVIWLEVGEEDRGVRLDRPLDRLEAEGDDFHRSVRRAYTDLAAAEADRFVAVDGAGTVDEVAERIWRVVEPRLATAREASPC